MPDQKILGWIPDLPDFRDYSINKFVVNAPETIAEKKAKPTDETLEIALKYKIASKLPLKVDLREFCSPVENQGNIGSCTAHAGISLVEYYEKRNHGSFVPASRLFLYKVTRNYMQLEGDTGANPRSTMAALVLFGTPPESHYKYALDNYDKEPPAFCYSFAQNYKTIKFFRHDLARPDTSRENILKSVKASLANGIPSMFGFTVYSSISEAEKNQGGIPFPAPRDRRLGGHAVATFGYDDKKEIKHPNTKDGKTTKGALLIQNSWGESWGEKGYGWLPYEYVLNGLAIDFWSILKKEWVDTDQFDDIEVK